MILNRAVAEREDNYKQAPSRKNFLYWLCLIKQILLISCRSLLAQLVERGTVNPEVEGSIPSWRAFIATN